MKKFLALLLVLVIGITAGVGGTVAYLTDTDEAVNVMTVGNVDILQHEYQRAEGVAHNAGESGKGKGVKEGDLVPFVQGQGLYPAHPEDDTAYTAEATDLFFWGDYVYSGTAGNGLWNDNKLAGVMDKMVFVENTGSTKAYFRTVMAFECPEGMEYSEGSDKEFMMNVNGSDLYNWGEGVYVTIDGVRYLVEVATYQNALEPGQQAHPSLLQVVMTHNATNEDMEKIGNTYEILVVTQAVQAENFEDAETALDTAFGDITVDNNPWVGEMKSASAPVKVVGENREDLQKDLKDKVNVEGAVVDANGAEITLGYAKFADDVTVMNAVINGSSNYGNQAHGDVTFINCTFASTGSYAAHFDAGSEENHITFKNCHFEGWNSFGTAIKGLTFENCTFGHNGNYGCLRVYQSATFNNCVFEEDFAWLDTNIDDTVVSFNNCEGIEGKIFNYGGIGIWYIDGTDVSGTVTTH